MKRGPRRLATFLVAAAAVVAVSVAWAGIASAATGTIEICKAPDNGANGVKFTFTATNVANGNVKTVNVKGGSCSNQLNAGTGKWQIEEDLATGIWNVTAIDVIPLTNSVTGSTDLANGDTTIKVTAGVETQVTYTNAQASATFKVCKWSATPGFVGATYSFTVLGQVLQAVAGDSLADAGCSQEITVQPGAKFSVSETVFPGQQVAGITTGGNIKLNSSLLGVAQVTAGSGANILFYDNEPVGPPQTGYVEVCKDNLDGLVNGSFTFTIKDSAGNKITEVVPVGQCTGPLLVQAGNVDITETAVANTYVSNIFTIPSTNLGPNNPTNGTATVVVVPAPLGQTNTETQVHFVNAAQLATLKVCKVLTSTSGALAGTTFNFTVSSSVFGNLPLSIIASSSPNGACKIFPLAFPIGTAVTVTEAGQSFVGVVGSPNGVGNGGSATTTVAAGINTVTLTNQAYGTIEVCKVMSSNAVDQAFNGTSFNFSVNGGTAFPVRAGLGCSGPMTVPAGTATVAETVPANFAFVSATGTDPSGQVDRTVTGTPKGGANPLTVNIPFPGGGGNETLVTFTDRVLRATFKICKLIDPGALTPLGGMNYTFTWSGAFNGNATFINGTNMVTPPYAINGTPIPSCTDILGTTTAGGGGLPVINPNGTPTTITVLETVAPGVFKVLTINVDNGTVTTVANANPVTANPHPGIVTFTFTNTTP